MSEYWKSTPKYWCKHCGVYVRDTKLERSNHEATGKHQGALKRFLRDLHRGHDREEREKDRAKREIERLNGVVPSSSSSTAGPSGSSSSSAPGGAAASSSSSAPRAPTTEAQRQKQWEQLAELGIDVPTELRGDMAMAGEWTVTNTRVVDDSPRVDADGNPRVDAMATGVRKRVKRDGEDEEEAAVQGLFKKTRRWGRDAKRTGDEDDAELDALLNGTLAPVAKKEKTEENAAYDPIKKEKEEEKEDQTPLKKEPSDDDQGVPDTVKPSVRDSEAPSVPVKAEGEDGGGGVEVPAVVFKKRKPKNIRQK